MKKLLFIFWVLAILVACSCSKSDVDKKVIIPVGDSTEKHFIKDL